jgi:hypothetical protein
MCVRGKAVRAMLTLGIKPYSTANNAACSVSPVMKAILAAYSSMKAATAWGCDSKKPRRAITTLMIKP